MIKLQPSKTITIVGLVLLYLIIATIGIFILSSKLKPKEQVNMQTTNDEPTPEVTINPNARMYTGTIKLGSSLKDSNCPSGIYLVAEEGGFLVDDKNMLQLRYLDEPNGIKLYEDESLIGKNVTITGEINDMKCEALTCECQSFILVDNVKSE